MQILSTAQDAERVASRVFYILLILISVALALFFAFADFNTILQITPDDTYYFLKTAENMAAGHGMTFDGLNPTNGYQPLWLLLLVPVYALIHASPEALTRICLIYQVILLAGAGMLFFTMLKRICSAAAALIAALVYFAWVIVPSANGMESAALIVALVALAYYGLKQHVFITFRAGTSLVFGLLLGLVALARLDMVFLAGAIFLIAIFPAFTGSARRRESILRTLFVGVGFLLVISPYLLYNQIVFGAVMPISGQLKSTFPQVSLGPESLAKVSRIKLLIGALGAAYLAWNLISRRSWQRLSPERKYLRAALLAMSVYAVLHLAHTLLFMHWGVYNWHFIAYNLFFAALVAEGIEALRPRLSNRLWNGGVIAAALVLILLTGRQLVGLADESRRDAFNWLTYESALWVRANTAPDDILAIKDTGTFGYFCRRRTINLDGLVNNREYQDALRAQRLHDYLAQHHVRYLAVHAFSEFPKLNGDYGLYRIKYWSRLYKTWSEELELPQQREIYRTSVYYDGPQKLPCAVCIWQLG